MNHWQKVLKSFIFCNFVVSALPFYTTISYVSADDKQKSCAHCLVLPCDECYSEHKEYLPGVIFWGLDHISHHFRQFTFRILSTKFLGQWGTFLPSSVVWLIIPYMSQICSANYLWEYFDTKECENTNHKFTDILSKGAAIAIGQY